jgi:hypothetical protein
MRQFFRDAMLTIGVLFAGLQVYLVWHRSDPSAVAPLPLTHPIGGPILVAALFIVAGLLNVAPWVSRLFRKTADAPKKNAQSEKSWADVMAEEDAKQIQERVKNANQRIEFHYAPGFDPHIDIITELWNGSVFELVSFGKISGHTLYAGKQLAAEPRIIVPVEPALLTLNHGDKATLVVRQYVTTDVADTMWANLNRGVPIDFESVAVSFKVLPRGPGFPNQEYRWWGPRFSIEDAKRV